MISPTQSFIRSAQKLGRWLASDAVDPRADEADRIDWIRCLPFIALHLACLAVFFVGVSWVAVAVCVALYAARMFFVTGFYHRYFSHRAFKTSRFMQTCMAALACTAGQRGPLWWAAHHRHHHKHSDEEPDLHSPHWMSFLRAHMGWFMTARGYQTDERLVRDWARYPELRWLNRFDWIPFIALALLTYGFGAAINAIWPQAGTSGWQMLVWGFVISTIVLYHATYTINSLAHRFGSQPYETGDDSRNNIALAVLTMGEGWHNNHHHYPASARQGFLWWEIDMTYYGLWILARLGLIHDLRPAPARVRRRRRS